MALANLKFSLLIFLATSLMEKILDAILLLLQNFLLYILIVHYLSVFDAMGVCCVQYIIAIEKNIYDIMTQALGNYILKCAEDI